MVARMSEDVLVVSGAASGIGRSICRLAAGRGMRVGLLDADGARAEAVAQSLRDGGARAAVREVDVTDWHALDVAFAELEHDQGPATKLACCAGIDVGGLLPEIGEQTLRRVLEVNLIGTLHLAALGIAGMRRGGSVVLVSSPAAFAAFPASAAYASSKGGVTAAVRALAVDHAAAGIRVNGLVPGSTDTPLMWANVADGEVDAVRGVVESEIPLGRLAHPDEPARAALWLLSDEASYVTGSHLVCDGGTLARASVSI
jgi:NAD(P)-dependent dehydrogenase (short-subunit alcohol dehydrogenase family)